MAARVALVAVGGAFSGRKPESGVDREADGAHRGQGRVERRSTILLVAGLVGQVVDEAAGDTLAELGVVGGVQDERVPAFVDLGGGGQARARVERAGEQEREGLVHDALGGGLVRAVVGHDPAGQPREHSGQTRSHEYRAADRGAALRCERGLSQSELAALAAASGRTTITREEVSRWEHDRRTPTPYWLSHLGVVLRVPPEALRPAVPGPWPGDASEAIADALDWLVGEAPQVTARRAGRRVGKSLARERGPCAHPLNGTS